MQNMDDHPPLDLSYLIEMVGHNPDFIKEVFDTFIEQTPIYLGELENALVLKNWEEVGNCAHKLKPTYTYIGRNDVKDFVQGIETNARSMIIDQIPSDIERLKIISAEIYVQLESAKNNIDHYLASHQAN